MRKHLLTAFKNAKTDKEFKQASFDVAAHCVWKQGDMSFTYSGVYGILPKYQNKNGLRCSLGHLIVGKFPSDLEGFAVRSSDEVLMEIKRHTKHDIDSNDRKFLADLQGCHDKAALGAVPRLS